MSEPARKRKAKSVTGDVVGPATAPAPNADIWLECNLVLSSSMVPVPNIDNAVRVLERHREWRDRVWFDEFTGRVMFRTTEGAIEEWNDAATLRLTLFLQRTVGIGKITPATVDAAVAVVAHANRRNCVQEWMRNLHWDGRPRVGDLFSIGFGAATSDYVTAVSTNFMISMVARASSPGAKVDNMVVLEGAQGVGKSSGLRALAGDAYFAEASEAAHSKDFAGALKGKLLFEISELDAFNRADSTTIKRIISCQTDRYRAPYGRRAEDHPRTCIFAGTTNRGDWQKDETGGRRFWPIACSAVNVEWITTNRDQLFAEAVALFDRGHNWWIVPVDDARREQDARREIDEWEVPIRRYLERARETQVAAVLEHGLGILPEHWTKAAQMRVAAILTGMGWTRKPAWREGKTVKVWALESPEGGNGGKNDPHRT